MDDISEKVILKWACLDENHQIYLLVRSVLGWVEGSSEKKLLLVADVSTTRADVSSESSEKCFNLFTI